MSSKRIVRYERAEFRPLAAVAGKMCGAIAQATRKTKPQTARNPGPVVRQEIPGSLPSSPQWPSSPSILPHGAN